MKKFRFSDPTGGGDDIIATFPNWVLVPDELSVRDVGGDRHYFEVDGEVDDDE